MHYFASQKNRLSRVIEYYTVEGITFLGNILLSSILVYYYGVHYLLATTIGFVLQVIVAFFVNRKWTFHEPGLKMVRGLITTLLIQTVGLCIILAITSFGVESLAFSFIAARISASIISGTYGYLAESYFTFKLSPLG